MTDTPPTIAHRDDIDRELAERAFSGTSFSPEQRGQRGERITPMP